MSSSFIRSLSADTVKIEVDGEILQACRICLAWDGKLYNIHERGLDQMYVDLMGTTLSAWDGLPQQLCWWCRALLLKAHALRARCRRAELLLKQALTQQQYITNNFIHTVDRTANKLTHTLCTGGKAEVQFYYHDDLKADEQEVDFVFILNSKNNSTDIAESHVKELDFDSDNDSVKNVIPEYNVDDLKVDMEDNITVDNFKDKISDLDTGKVSDIEIVRTDIEELKTNKPIKRKKRPNRKTKDEKTTVKLVKKKERQSKASVADDYKEFEKKYDFEVTCLTDAEMAEDMEKRKESDKYLKGTYKCELCYKSFMAANIYENHMKTHAPARGDNECKLCHIRFYYPVKLRHHVQSAHRLRLRCRRCGERARGKASAVLHAAYHAGTTFPCAHCDKRFLKKTSRSSHMRAAHPAENAAGGACDECGETFTSRTGLKAHKTRSHNKANLPELKCRKCSIQFHNMEALKRHRETMPENKCNPNLSACEQCGETCLNQDELILHKHTQHSIELYTCDTCSKSFTSKSSLATHTDRVHRHIRPPKGCDGGARDWLHWATVCEHCGKRLSCMATLKIHMNKHTGDRPYKCKLCPKAYMTPYGLNNHQAAHTGERKWQCPECPATFLHQSSVYQHRKIHTGERSHQCKICDKYFTQSGSLYTHVKYVHRKETPPPRKRTKKSV